MPDTTFRTLIMDYFEKGEIQNIITLCEAFKDQRDRAEAKLTHLTHLNAKLAESFRNITEPATGRRVVDPEPATVPKNTAPSGEKLKRPSSAPKPKAGFDTSDIEF